MPHHTESTRNARPATLSLLRLPVEPVFRPVSPQEKRSPQRNESSLLARSACSPSVPGCGQSAASWSPEALDLQIRGICSSRFLQSFDDTVCPITVSNRQIDAYFVRLTHKSAVPRWVETSSFLSLGEAPTRTAARVSSLCRTIACIYTAPGHHIASRSSRHVRLVIISPSRFCVLTEQRGSPSSQPCTQTIQTVQPSAPHLLPHERYTASWATRSSTIRTPSSSAPSQRAHSAFACVQTMMETRFVFKH